jgi:hypothetical protein
VSFAYLRPAHPQHLALIGPPGVGKTHLAKQTRLPHLSIDVLRADGGDWEHLVCIMGRATTPMVIESVGAPNIYLAALIDNHALLVRIRCDEHVRQQRLAGRPAHLCGDYVAPVKPHLTIDTTTAVDQATIDRVTRHLVIGQQPVGL